MSDPVHAVLLALAGSVAFALVAVLPGLALADRLLRPIRSLPALVLASLVISQALLAATGLLLIGIGAFSGLAVAAVMIMLSVASIPALARRVREARGPAPARIRREVAGGILVMALLAIPWVVLAGSPGWPPADTLQWYYAGLGRQLTAAGGVPDAVAEWGMHLRWLPDYLVFNVGSEAYLALLGFLPRADALAAWRVPLVVAGMITLCAVLRLWVVRPLAIAGTVILAATTFFLAKFDAYKPEAVGIVIGLAALWLVVMGVRHGRRSWILLGGAALGIDLSIHAIAATVVSLLVIGFSVAELAGRRSNRWPVLGWLARAALLGLLVSIVMGVGVQGRPLVATGAMNPAAIEGSDPTWTFFLRSTGTFDVPEPEPPRRPLAGGVTTPWPGLRITSALGWWLLPCIGIGLLAFAYLGGRRPRSGVAGLLAGGVLLLGGIAYFALAFDTYVPRWTGLVRFGQYLPLVAGLAATFAGAGYLRAWGWLADARAPRALLPLSAALGVAFLVPWATAHYADEIRIGEPGRAALETTRQFASPGELILSNALTTGTLESFTGLEAPLEGRQPLIEQPAILATANEVLQSAHDWFANPASRAFIDRLGITWVLATDAPSILGANASLGGSPATLRSIDYLHERWTGDGVVLFEVDAPSRAGVVDSRTTTPDLGRFLAVLGVGVLGVALLVLPPSMLRRRPRWPGTA